MKPTFYKVSAIGAGSISVMAKPVPEWLSDEIQGLAAAGINVVVSLLQRSEVYELGLAKEADLCRASGIEFISFPIPDRGLPPTGQSFSQTVRTIFDLVNAGRNVMIHCRAGIGRSGLTAAAVLLRSGLSAQQAFDLVSSARGVPVPDTEEQRNWLNLHQSELRG